MYVALSHHEGLHRKSKDLKVRRRVTKSSTGPMVGATSTQPPNVAAIAAGSRQVQQTTQNMPAAVAAALAAPAVSVSGKATGVGEGGDGAEINDGMDVDDGGQVHDAMSAGQERKHVPTLQAAQDYFFLLLLCMYVR